MGYRRENFSSLHFYQLWVLFFFRMPPPSDNAIAYRYYAVKANGYLPWLAEAWPLRFAMLKARAFLAPRPRWMMMLVLRSALQRQFNSLDDKVCP